MTSRTPSPSLTPSVGPDGVERKYRRLDQIEHVLQRPDTYVGSLDPTSVQTYVMDESTQRMTERTLTYVPGLYKIFDEILVNASDNKQRDRAATDVSPKIEMTYIEVKINKEKGMISVENDGYGIPIYWDEVEQCYIPHMIFGMMMSGDNFDDQASRVTGGRNGLGAKLANIFSTQFIVECCTDGVRYKQVFKNNMNVAGTPETFEATRGSRLPNKTKITFFPELSRFQMTELDDNIIYLMSRRVYDVAACNPKLRVTLNDKKIKFNSFTDYAKLFLPEDTKIASFTSKGLRPWDVVVAACEDGPKNMSFVNSIWTVEGGKHVDSIVKQVSEYVVKKIPKSKMQNKEIKPARVKPLTFVFIRCLIDKPTFSSQTKEVMTKPIGQKKNQDIPDPDEGQIDAADLKKLDKIPLAELLLQKETMKSELTLAKKTDGKKTSRLTGIPKLDDATLAGTKQAKDCTLILTEGDSAKTMVIGGLSAAGSDRFGVFPLRGKVLNVRGATNTQKEKNEEFTNLKKILGLQHGKKYEDTNSLRYGHVMIMTDQDLDGSHIKGLLINLFETEWPTLLKIPSFLQFFITPIVKCTKGTQVVSFYTEPEFKRWRETHQTGWKIKYYKGLGTSSVQEAREYFSDLPFHRKDFEWNDDAECKESIDLAFNKNRPDDRKQWMNKYKSGTYIDLDGPSVTYPDFINHELVIFSRNDCARSIPSMLDGFKPSQRKIIYACFKRNLTKEVKVTQLAGYVSEVSAYHHAEQGLQPTICSLAQDYVGSNNLNLLLPIGQFGSRLKGGADCSAPRYITTKLSPLARIVFNANDDPLLNYLDDDGQRIEPEWYVPIIPFSLVNGSKGIGTGWSTNVPCFNPLDIVRNIRHKIHHEEMEEIKPWYRDFTGEIIKVPGENKYISYGRYYTTPEGTLEITELPVGKWTEDYKAFLDKNMQETAPSKRWVKEFFLYPDPYKVHFSVHLTDEHLHDFDRFDGYHSLELTTSISLNNMTMFDENGNICQYKSPNEIIDSFYGKRLEYYHLRKKAMIDRLTKQLRRLDNKQRFILMVVREELNVRNRPKKDIVQDLRRHKFDELGKTDKDWSLEDPKVDEEDEESESDGTQRGGSITGFDYLLSMPISSLTKEKVDEILAEFRKKETELEVVRGKTIEKMWEEDLDEFEVRWEENEKERIQIMNEVPKSRRQNKGGRGKYDDDDDFGVKSKKKPVKKATALQPVVVSSRETWSEVKPELATKLIKKAEAESKRMNKKGSSSLFSTSSSAMLKDEDGLDNLFSLAPSREQTPGEETTGPFDFSFSTSSKPKAKRGAAKVSKPKKSGKKAKFEDDDESDFGDEAASFSDSRDFGGEDSEPTTFSISPIKPKPQRVRKLQPAITNDDDDEDSDPIQPLSESESSDYHQPAKPVKRSVPTESKKVTPTETKKPAPKAKTKQSDLSNFFSLDTSPPRPTLKTAAAKPKSQKLSSPKKTLSKSSDDDDFFSKLQGIMSSKKLNSPDGPDRSLSLSAPSVKPKAAPKSTVAKAPVPKPSLSNPIVPVASLSASAPVVTRPKRNVNTKRIIQPDSDDEDDDEDSYGGGDDDDDDFED
ncbi:putative DNA topoisomerase 2 [Blattamonas nauphoetae]|uniref:DNA topoisomerase 2 n=1 Tax=Blattamonas nauphoetae TaxID=2049346 RepID=A0ABQ9XZ08_9EUKA|nr:putative DNA topoisomerase 2 [Blattamonas nauphoetae]